MRHRMDSTVLIEEIRRRPVLWDRRHVSHPNRRLHDMHWDAIAAAMGTRRESVRAKWKNLRDAYRKVLKKARLDGNPIQWMYYDQLSFIRDQTLASRDRCRSVLYPADADLMGAVKEEIDREDTDGDDDEEGSAAPPAADDGLAARDDSTALRRLAAERRAAMASASAAAAAGYSKGFKRRYVEEDADRESDPDYQFLMSLLPHIKDVSLSRKLPLRMRIEAIVHEAAYAK